ncbi:MAG: 30S ribosomal protein S17 [Thermoleophilaceae bacterium]
MEQRRVKATRRRAWRARSRERRKAAQTAAEPTPPTPKSKGKAKLRQGVVVSDRADKTITVRIDSQRAHRMYGKVVRTSSTLHAHDEANDAHVGDTVRVIESRPVSKKKRWRLVEVLERAR